MNDTLSTQVSPGLGGFIAFFVLALALWLLMRSMNGKLRNIAYRGEQEGAPRRRTQHTRRRGVPAGPDATPVAGPDVPGGDGEKDGDDPDQGQPGAGSPSGLTLVPQRTDVRAGTRRRSD